MDALYSLSLLVSLIAGGAGVLLGVLAAFSSKSTKSMLRFGSLSTVLGVAALVVSVAVHRYWGHGPESVEPMAWSRFVEFHTAFIVAAILLAAGLVVCLFARLRLAQLVLLVISTHAGAGEFDVLTQPYPPWMCSNCAEWNVPHKPFRIHAESYYVGTEGLSAILITSPEGHILIDGALPQSAPLILENIRALGFDPADIELILNSHVHYDHAGGIAAIRHVTGARVAASAKSAEVLERGRSGLGDPQYGTLLAFPPVSAVERIEPGGTLRLGSIEVTAHATPGHTPGGTSWSWVSCNDEGCLNLVYADSLAPISAEGFRFTDNEAYPDLLEEYESGFETLEALPCDILISTHPVSSSLWKRFESGPAGLLDAQACVVYVESARSQVARRVERERR